MCVQSRLEEIRADNAKYLELKAEYEREKQLRYVPVFCKGNYVTLTIHETQTGAALLQEARDALVRKASDAGTPEASIEVGSTSFFLSLS